MSTLSVQDKQSGVADAHKHAARVEPDWEDNVVCTLEFEPVFDLRTWSAAHTSPGMNKRNKNKGSAAKSAAAGKASPTPAAKAISQLYIFIFLIRVKEENNALNFIIDMFASCYIIRLFE